MSNLDDIFIVTETQEKLLREVEDCLSDENDLVKEIAIILREALLKPKAAILDTLREDLIPDVLYIPAALKRSLFSRRFDLSYLQLMRVFFSTIGEVYRRQRRSLPSCMQEKILF